MTALSTKTARKAMTALATINGMHHIDGWLNYTGLYCFSHLL